MMPLAEVLTGAVKTSPSGMLTRPSQEMAGMPLMQKERSVRAGPLMRTRSVLFMRVFEGLHGPAHFRVIEGADVEVEILEGLGAHLGHLGHGGRWASGGRPSGFF